MSAKRVIAGAVAFLLGGLPLVVLGQGTSPLGQWEVTTGESRFSISHCEDTETLCAKLTWLREDVRNEANLAALDTYVVRGARSVADNTWTGEYVFEGKSYSATMTMVSPNLMRVNSCAGLLLCAEVELTRL